MPGEQKVPLLLQLLPASGTQKPLLVSHALLQHWLLPLQPLKSATQVFATAQTPLVLQKLLQHSLPEKQLALLLLQLPASGATHWPFTHASVPRQTLQKLPEWPHALLLLPVTHTLLPLKQPPVQVPPVQKPELQVEPFVQLLQVVPLVPHALLLLLPPSRHTPELFTQPWQLKSMHMPPVQV